MLNISREKFFVLSDDLTGANGISGMMAKSGEAVTINREAIFNNKRINFNYDFLTINTKSRMLDGENAYEIINEIKNYLVSNGIRIAKRIDSTMRGNIEKEALPFLEDNSIIMTATIPEFGRYTEKGKTITPEGSIEILDKFREVEAIPLEIDKLKRERIEKGKVYIVDSKTHFDIEKIAHFVHKNGYVPMDPIPLCSRVAELYLPGKIKKISLPKVNSMAFVVGSQERKTISQIEYAILNGIKMKKIDEFEMEFSRALIIKLRYMEQKHLINEHFIENIRIFYSYFLSGGETANAVFEASGGDYIESIGDYMPLVGIGRVHGGKLDGKIIVTKGGMIGSENIYMEILDTLTGDIDENRNYTR